MSPSSILGTISSPFHAVNSVRPGAHRWSDKFPGSNVHIPGGSREVMDSSSCSCSSYSSYRSRMGYIHDILPAILHPGSRLRFLGLPFRWFPFDPERSREGTNLAKGTHLWREPFCHPGPDEALLYNTMLYTSGARAQRAVDTDRLRSELIQARYPQNIEMHARFSCSSERLVDYVPNESCLVLAVITFDCLPAEERSRIVRNRIKTKEAILRLGSSDWTLAGKIPAVERVEERYLSSALSCMFTPWIMIMSVSSPPASEVSFGWTNALECFERVKTTTPT